MTITYSTDITPITSEIIELYTSSGIRRPVEDPDRITKMHQHGLIITAWDDKKLIGIARSLSDFCYCCYLADLAVNKEYQQQGIGKKLVELTKEKIGPETSLLLVSAPGAMDYYPKIGFEPITNGFIIKRIPY